MATKIVQATVQKTEVQSLTGTIQGKRYKVVLDDISHGDTWDPSVLPVLQGDGLGKVNIVDGATEFVFRDDIASTIQFAAAAGQLKVAKFFILQKQEDKEDDGASESV